MTKDEALKLARDFIQYNTGSSHYVIEQIDLALAQPEKEPVAVVVSTSRTDDGFRAVVETGDELLDLDTLLYTTPPQRTWVGLTDEEIEQMGLSNYIKVVRETEAKLKEKNNG